MIGQRFVILFFLIFFIQQTIQYRQRRNLDLINWQSAEILFKQLYLDQTKKDTRTKYSEIPSELRPVEGPINIEQLPAMLAARNVKRYPYSQQVDPAIIGR